MNIRTIEVNGLKLAVVNSSEKLISDAQSAFDFMMAVQYETGSNHLTMENKIPHGGNPVLRWMMDNIYIKMDPAGNIKRTKRTAPNVLTVLLL